MIKATIKRDTEGKGLWLIIEHDEDEDNNTICAIQEDEVEAILIACQKWQMEQKGRGR